jgi:hypothetical protein
MDAYGTKVDHTGDPCLHSTHSMPVELRLVVFKPFVSEVLIGKVESSTEEGIRGTKVPYILIYGSIDSFTSLYDILR